MMHLVTVWGEMRHLADFQVRSAVLIDGEQFTAKLSHYPAGLVQPAHEHASTQLSFLLAGSVEESTNEAVFRLSTAHRCWKPKAAVHSNAFGPLGALILSVRFRCEATADLVAPAEQVSWHRMREGEVRGVLAAVQSDSASRCDWLWDQLAIAAGRPPPGHVPDWLKWVRHQLERAPQHSSIAGLAEEVGVHRVHLSREFSRHYGMGPTAFRQRRMVAAALNRLLHHRLPPAIAAQEAGFADQSHMIRTMKLTLGCGAGPLVRAFS